MGGTYRLAGKGLPKLDSKEVGDHILVMRVPDAVKSDGTPPSAKQWCCVPQRLVLARATLSGEWARDCTTRDTTVHASWGGGEEATGTGAGGSSKRAADEAAADEATAQRRKTEEAAAAEGDEKELSPEQVAALLAEKKRALLARLGAA